ncbi:hypothetical protein [Frigoriflavimonas asaccharolytica]|uniref:Lipocalin-like protein n=1 Tax=Frigoriflavimonas asaccharolytica TaxID=2735899 RepID=A0A8J8GDB4_9FLAO|nr:hypothetical protein [Frigoriflavimonas asaccharolytica]NRS93850.1 hypothetical protein [Frigoriflavimonas asaccharolytica]
MDKTILTTFLIVFSLFSCKQSNDTPKPEINNNLIVNSKQELNLDDFIGEWTLANTSNSVNDHTFSINFSKNKKQFLEGYYCAVAKHGNKIDCATDKEINIKEIKKDNDGIIISFMSFFGAENGEAKLTLSEGKLHWQVTKKPIGEFYCPLDAFLVKKKEEVILSSQNNSKIVNLTSENYKGKDITMQLYKEIIESYGCGDNSVKGMSLGNYNSVEIFILENDCGDFPFKDIVSVKNGKIIDKLEIESDSWDIEKDEKNIRDETILIFNIDNLSNINITKSHLIDSKIDKVEKFKYLISTNGEFIKK